ncbi:uncharacterized protein LOC108666456 [Hyalella azteca]|uniref:Uncharacterized protein LOC108666456 n=1 Tax=Hyalella azteca TaxID=294128 RepID=A0A8B7N6B8_HYAAZ|nr:uncharacterized protein LOC108666456 [Hyalella azteca]XP_018008824.1 uncharacterized protein LOC108666456 [Hyalella azteca]XP_018008825.1 uncharacterized protein LOC108666456 [Hyalella azteca]
MSAQSSDLEEGKVKKITSTKSFVSNTDVHQNLKTQENKEIIDFIQSLQPTDHSKETKTDTSLRVMYESGLFNLNSNKTGLEDIHFDARKKCCIEDLCPEECYEGSKQTYHNITISRGLNMIKFLIKGNIDAITGTGRLGSSVNNTWNDINDLTNFLFHFRPKSMTPHLGNESKREPVANLTAVNKQQLVPLLGIQFESTVPQEKLSKGDQMLGITDQHLLGKYDTDTSRSNLNNSEVEAIREIFNDFISFFERRSNPDEAKKLKEKPASSELLDIETEWKKTPTSSDNLEPAKSSQDNFAAENFISMSGAIENIPVTEIPIIEIQDERIDSQKDEGVTGSYFTVTMSNNISDFENTNTPKTDDEILVHENTTIGNPMTVSSSTSRPNSVLLYTEINLVNTDVHGIDSEINYGTTEVFDVATENNYDTELKRLQETTEVGVTGKI